MEKLTKKKLIQDLKAIGIKRGYNLLISSALSQVGWIEGGASTVLESLREVVGEEGGIFGNSFTPLYKLPLNHEDSKKIFDKETPAYSGFLINLMLKMPESIRSRHPSCSNVGIGPFAWEILKDHDALKPAYEPAHKLAENGNGWMLKLGTYAISPGVTTVHVAQNLLGFRNNAMGRFGVNYRSDDGSVKLFVKNYAGGCNFGFGKFYSLYKKNGALLEGNIGNAHCALLNLKKTLEVDLQVLKEDPTFFLCDNPLCYSCRVSWDFSPESRIAFKLKYLFTKAIPATKKYFK